MTNVVFLLLGLRVQSLPVFWSRRFLFLRSPKILSGSACSPGRFRADFPEQASGAVGALTPKIVQPPPPLTAAHASPHTSPHPPSAAGHPSSSRLPDTAPLRYSPIPQSRFPPQQTDRRSTAPAAAQFLPRPCDSARAATALRTHPRPAAPACPQAAVAAPSAPPHSSDTNRRPGARIYRSRP